MRLTVVICTHNRSSLLMTAINSLNHTAQPTECDIRILVIANACEDDTVANLCSYQNNHKVNKSLPLVFEEEHIPGKSYALNHAIKLVHDGYICFIDDDHRVDNNYFSAVSSAIKCYSNTRIFCGRIIPDWTGNEPDWVHTNGDYKIFPLPIPNFQLGDKPTIVNSDSKLPGGGNLIIHKSIFDVFGEFSTSLGPKGNDLLGSEDSEFILRTISHNEAIQYIPDIIQYHYVDTDRLKLTYLIQKSFQRTRSITLAHNPDKTRVPPYIWRKLINYSIGVILSFSLVKTRFYLMRIAATLGEAKGLRETMH